MNLSFWVWSALANGTCIGDLLTPPPHARVCGLRAVFLCFKLPGRHQGQLGCRAFVRGVFQACRALQRRYVGWRGVRLRPHTVTCRDRALSECTSVCRVCERESEGRRGREGGREGGRERARNCQSINTKHPGARALVSFLSLSFSLSLSRSLSFGVHMRMRYMPEETV